MSVKEKMTAIADSIRGKTKKADKLTLDDMASEIEEVYDAGKKTEWRNMWEGLQRKNGILQPITRYYFFGSKWNDTTFLPRYNLVFGTSPEQAFGSSEITDLVSILKKQNISLDTSPATSMVNTFAYSKVTHLPEISCVNCTGLLQTFDYAKVISIEKLILPESGACTFSNTFRGCSSLTHMIVEGTIGQNGFKVSESTKLTHDSLMSIINALKDYAGSGTTHTVTLGTTNLGKLTDNEKAIATQKGWTLA